MQITIYTASSVDGFLSTLDGNSDWVLDDEIFEKTVTEHGCIVLGRTTFEQYENELYPMDGVQHFVLASEAKEVSYKNVLYVTSVDEVIAKVQERGFSKLLVIGGSKTNESFMQSGKASKLLIDVHPIVLGNGKKLFGNFDMQINLRLLSSDQFPEGFTHIEYEIIV